MRKVLVVLVSPNKGGWEVGGGGLVDGGWMHRAWRVTGGSPGAGMSPCGHWLLGACLVHAGCLSSQCGPRRRAPGTLLPIFNMGSNVPGLEPGGAWIVVVT